MNSLHFIALFWTFSWYCLDEFFLFHACWLGLLWLVVCYSLLLWSSIDVFWGCFAWIGLFVRTFRWLLEKGFKFILCRMTVQMSISSSSRDCSNSCTFASRNRLLQAKCGFKFIANATARHAHLKFGLLWWMTDCSRRRPFKFTRWLLEDIIPRHGDSNFILSLTARSTRLDPEWGEEKRRMREREADNQARASGRTRLSYIYELIHNLGEYGVFVK